MQRNRYLVNGGTTQPSPKERFLCTFNLPWTNFTYSMDLEEDIPENHLVRIVNEAVNRLNDGIFASAYPGGGRDSYHPKMLTKVILYAYTQRIYSSRQIAKAIRENVGFAGAAALLRHTAHSTRIA
ncbi:transposase [Cohnella boryungensis]|uniref:Transposase n=1 Tax=Cohnella boryungensis TaxID=768479 RepID=A0ABV8SFX9_9BACL